jgi:predicted dehydrogenase
MVEIVASGAIGEIEHVETSFTFTSEMTENYRLLPEMGGGALLDVGCYQAHAWVAFLDGAHDLEITSLARTLGPTGIDLTTDVNVRINQVSTAHAVSSFELPSQQQFVIRGTNGELRTTAGESFTTWNEGCALALNGIEEQFAPANAFVEMVEHVSRVVTGEDSWIVSSADSIRVAEILDLISRHP